MRVLAGIVVLALAGCAKDAPVVLGMQVAPAECYVERDAGEKKVKDPRWVALPDRDVKRAETARTIRTNKDKFAELQRLRDICDAGLRGA